MLIDAREAAERLGITERTLRNWISAGKLAKITDDRGRPRYREEEIDRLKSIDPATLERDQMPGTGPEVAAPTPGPGTPEISGLPALAEAHGLKRRLVVLRLLYREVRSDRDFLREELRRRHDELLHMTRELHLAKLETTQLKGQLQNAEERAARPWWRRIFGG